MSKYNIKCFAIPEGTKHRDWQISPEGRIWACCNFANAYDKRHDLNGNLDSATLFDDPIMAKLLKDDPDFNSLEKHTLEEIIEHDVFQNYIHHKGWKSDNPPLCCVTNCNYKQIDK